MTSPTYHADDDQLADEHARAVPENTLTEPDPDLAAPDAEQAVHEDPASQPAAPVALADDGPADSVVPDYPGFTADGDGGGGGAEQPGMAGSTPVNPSLVSVALTVPESVTESHLAGDAASAAGPWNEIQAMFVDDPAASVERAAGLVDDRVEALIQSVRERQRSVQSAGQADHAGTEELRVALQHYRAFWTTLEDLPA